MLTGETLLFPLLADPIRHQGRHTVVINATSVGIEPGDAPPMDIAALCRAAQARGCTAIGGSAKAPA